MSGSTSRYAVEVVGSAARGIYAAMGTAERDLPVLVDQIIDATLRGHPGQGQGIEKLPKVWERFKGGTVSADAVPEVVSEGPAWVHVDANKSWGPVAGAFAMDATIAKAESAGVGTAVVRRSNHYGTSGYYAMRAAAAGLIGVAMTNAGPEMAPWGGVTPLLGTNPWGIAVPRKPFALVLDMALTQSGKGMIRWAKAQGLPVPPNWAYAPDGTETTDPDLALLGPLVPVGEFKGTGLSLMTDILTGVMSGAAFGTGAYADPAEHDVGHLMLAIDYTRFVSQEAFAHRLEKLVSEVKSCEPKQGVDEILLPGELEHRRMTERRRYGVPIEDATVTELRGLCKELGITCPL